MDSIDRIREYYQKGDELDRLQQPEGRLEFLRTQELLGRHLTAGPLKILDAGGGTGPYAFWLSGLEHEVHLLDLTPLHIEKAREFQRNAEFPLASLQTGDARQLPYPAETFDWVLCMGPLYHLQDPADRQAVLSEAMRVLRPGGRFFGVVISRFAGLLDGATSGHLKDPEYQRLVMDVLPGGCHFDVPGKNWFTDAWFQHPGHYLDEPRAAGFCDCGCIPIEGFAWFMKDLREWLEDPALWSFLQQVLRATESETSLLGVSSHVLVHGRKPIA